MGALKQVLDTGIKEDVAVGGEKIENPASSFKRTRVPRKELRLPASDQFHELLKAIRDRKDGFAPHIVDLVEFLDFGGMRAYLDTPGITLPLQRSASGFVPPRQSFLRT